MTKIFAVLTAASIALTSSLALAASGDVAPTPVQPVAKPAVAAPQAAPLAAPVAPVAPVAQTQTPAPVKADEKGKTDVKPAEVKKEEKKS